VIVLDASVLIAHFNARDAHHDAAGELLEGSIGEPLGASTITLAEVLAGPAAIGRLEDATAALADLTVAELGLGDAAASELAMLRAQTRLKLPDCCVLLAARRHGATLATFDDRLLVAADRLGLVTLGRRSP
jgi:predicted nucleic acid-binding protein